MSRKLETRLKRLEESFPKRTVMFFRSFCMDHGSVAKTATEGGKKWVREESESEKEFLARVKAGLDDQKCGVTIVMLT